MAQPKAALGTARSRAWEPGGSLLKPCFLGHGRDGKDSRPSLPQHRSWQGRTGWGGVGEVLWQGTEEREEVPARERWALRLTVHLPIYASERGRGDHRHIASEGQGGVHWHPGSNVPPGDRDSPCI